MFHDKLVVQYLQYKPRAANIAHCFSFLPVSVETLTPWNHRRNFSLPSYQIAS